MAGDLARICSDLTMGIQSTAGMAAGRAAGMVVVVGRAAGRVAAVDTCGATVPTKIVDTRCA